MDDLDGDAKHVRWSSKREYLKNIKMIFGHVFLIVALIIYTAAGAWVFRKLEYAEEIQRKMDLQKRLDTETSNFIDDVQKLNLNKGLSQEVFKTNLSNLVRNFTEILEDIRSKGWHLNETRNVTETAAWKDFGKSAFFASTVITTIGYGDMAPVTRSGRLFCMLFAMVGIPFTLTVIADVGKSLAWIYSVAKKRIKKSCSKRKRAKKSQEEEEKEMVGRQQSKWKKIGKSAKILAVFLWLLLYIALGGYLFTNWEKWDFFDSFYFCFITMTTIGLGDLVPENTSYMILCIYIMIGLALTSFAIELVRSQYADSWKKMKELSTRLGPLAESLKKYQFEGLNLDVNVGQDLKQLKKILAVYSGKSRREGSIWKKFWENEDGYDDGADSNEPRLIQIIIYESSV